METTTSTTAKPRLFWIGCRDRDTNNRVLLLETPFGNVTVEPFPYPQAAPGKWIATNVPGDSRVGSLEYFDSADDAMIAVEDVLQVRTARLTKMFDDALKARMDEAVNEENR